MSFIDKSFKIVINKLVIKRPQVTTVQKKTLILSLPYLGDISLKTRTKLRKSFKSILNCCKLQIVFKSQRKLANVFRFKDHLPFDLVSGVVYKYRCGRWNSSHYGDFFTRAAEHMGISNLTGSHLKSVKQSAVSGHLLKYNCSIDFDHFDILTYDANKFESLLTKVYWLNMTSPS